MLTKMCIICGKSFTTDNYRSKYCSDECKKEGRKLTRQKWLNDSPDYMDKWQASHPNYNRNWRATHPNYERDRSRARRGTIEHKKTCPVCGKEFVTMLPQKICCSSECSEIRRNEKRRERDKGRKRRDKTPEQQHANYIKRKYGSQENYEAYIKARAESVKNAEAKKAEAKAETKAAKLKHKICVVCGAEFDTYNPCQRTCCNECSRKPRNAKRQKRIPGNQIVDKDITLGALFKRDSGVCYLCGKKCDWQDKNGETVGDRYPSIDHVIPIAAGGLHAWDNVRLAHFRCNRDKSDKILPHIEKLDPDYAYKYKRNIEKISKSTVQYSKDGNIIATYESAAAAARATGLKSKSIQNCARGECKTYGGYRWAYI